MSTISRRKFLQIGGLAAGASLLPMPVKWLGSGPAIAFYQSSGIPLFKTPLRLVELPICAPDSTPAPVTGVKHYTISIQEYQDQIIPLGNGYNQTTLWGYDPAKTVQEALGLAKPAQAHLGGLILANRNEPIQITFRNKLNKTYNNLPLTKHIIPVDSSAFFPDAALAINKTATHLHGGYIPWISDGGPYDSWGPDGSHGQSFLNNVTLNPSAVNGEAEYYYGNNQSARLMWYHDHAHDITRVNAYAGIASAYVLRDLFEANLIASGLPPYIESSVTAGAEIQEIPLVFQDKIFVGTNIKLLDPSWKNIVSASAQGPGSLWYPHLYESNRWRKTFSTRPLPNPSCIAEMFGDTMLVNGMVYPEKVVEPRRYRLRLLNACNARFLNLQLYIDNGSPDGITLNAAGVPTNAPFLNPATGGKPSLLQIATEGGFMPKAVEVPTNVPFSLNAAINTLNPVGQGSLIVGCAERFDLIVDFSSAAGKKVVLYSDSPAPFPGGDPRNDYFPGLVNGNPVNLKTLPGKGPNTRVLMRFNVSKPLSSNDNALTIFPGTSFEAMPAVIDQLKPTLPHTWNDPLIVPLNAAGVPDLTKIPAFNTDGVTPITVRRMTLNEVFDQWGRLMQLVGTDQPQLGGGYGVEYLAPITEIINLNGKPSVREIWQIANLTADVHPMHFHLVNVQILKRRPINPLSPFTAPGTTGNSFTDYFDKFTFTGAERAPDLNETGWKETCRMNPGEVITVIMEFSLPKITGPDAVTSIDLTSKGGGLGTPPPSPRTGDHEYVWHCHILEHEEHDMMRPVVVKA